MGARLGAGGPGLYLLGDRLDLVPQFLHVNPCLVCSFDGGLLSFVSLIWRVSAIASHPHFGQFATCCFIMVHSLTKARSH